MILIFSDLQVIRQIISWKVKNQQYYILFQKINNSLPVATINKMILQ